MLGSLLLVRDNDEAGGTFDDESARGSPAALTARGESILKLNNIARSAPLILKTVLINVANNLLNASSLEMA